MSLDGLAEKLSLYKEKLDQIQTIYNTGPNGIYVHFLTCTLVDAHNGRVEQVFDIRPIKVEHKTKQQQQQLDDLTTTHHQTVSIRLMIRWPCGEILGAFIDSRPVGEGRQIVYMDACKSHECIDEYIKPYTSKVIHIDNFTLENASLEEFFFLLNTYISGMS